MADSRRVLLVGGGDLAEEVCEALDAAGAEVTWLEHTDDASLREGLAAKPDVVCVATRSDAFPLRIALLVRHLDADVPLLVTIFDPGIAEQIAETVPNCRVTSIADIVAPSLAGPCISEDLLAVLRDGERTVGLDEALEEVELPPRQAHRLRSLTAAVLRPYDRSAALLFYGFAGLVDDAVLRAGRRDDRARPAVRRRRATGRPSRSPPSARTPTSTTGRSGSRSRSRAR